MHVRAVFHRLHFVLTLWTWAQKKLPVGAGTLHPPVCRCIILVNLLILAGCPVSILRCTSGTFLGPKAGTTVLTNSILPLGGRGMFLRPVSWTILRTVVCTTLRVPLGRCRLLQGRLKVVVVRPRLLPITSPPYRPQRTLL